MREYTHNALGFNKDRMDVVAKRVTLRHVIDGGGQ
jgi:hypothetical protein